jgi:hypothetical protein
MRNGGQGRPILKVEGMKYLTRQGDMGVLFFAHIICSHYLSISILPVDYSNCGINARKSNCHNMFLINF